MEAQRHGSTACRDKLYFVGFKCPAADYKLPHDDLEALIGGTQLEALPAWKLLQLDFDVLGSAQVQVAGEQDRTDGQGKSEVAERKNALYKDDHLDLYALFHLQWPPELAGPSYRGLTRRAGEVLYFANEVWPFTETSEGDMEFIDVNNSLRDSLARSMCVELASLAAVMHLCYLHLGRKWQ